MGRDSEFSEYAAARWRTLVGSAVLMGASPTEAEDVAQTTLMRTYVAWRRVRNAENPDAYVVKILLNSFREGRRRRSWHESPTAEVPDLIDPSDASLDPAAMREALADLPQGQRAVLVLRYYLRLTESEIALALGVAPGTVTSRLSRGLRTLSVHPIITELREEKRP